MRRREFIAIAGSAAAWPLAARAQSTRVPSVGYLAPGRNERLLAAIQNGLRKLGHVEGHTFTLIYRSAEGNPEALAPLAAELVRLSPSVIVALGAGAAHAIKRLTKTTPIVIAPAGDALLAGLVESLARPEGNLTGVSINTWVLNQKRLEILKETFPRIRRVAVLGNASNPHNVAQWQHAKPAGEALKLELALTLVNTVSELPAAFTAIIQSEAGALSVLADATFDVARYQIVELAAKHRLPTIYEHRAFVEAGGLMSYGPNLDHVSYRAASFVDRILKGTSTADLPIEEPTKFELIVNSKVAEAQNFTIHPLILARADEVIE